jgi:hypothetical protein
MGTYHERTGLSRDEAVFAGTIAGMLAGLMALIFSMIIAVLIGSEMWVPIKMIALTVFDETSIRGGLDMLPILAGLGLYLLTAIALGVTFAIWGGRQDYGPAVGWGVMYGMAVWLVMQFIVLPVVNPTLARVSYALLGILHGIYGATLGIYPAFVPGIFDNHMEEKAAA